MPATKDHILAIARTQLGYQEQAGNKTRFGRWYGLDGVPWCAIFISWIADRAQAEDIIPRHAYTPAGAAWFMKHGRWSQGARRGDIVYYMFPGMHRISHVGIVEAVHRDGSITAIEGNTDFAGGRTGGRVMRKRRSRSLIAGFGHPDYSTPAQMARLKREAEAAARASRLAKARALAAAKVAAAKKHAAAALATNRRKAAAAAAAAALAALAAGGTAAITDGPSGPTPQPSTTASPSASTSPSAPPTAVPTAVTPTPKPTTTRPTAKPAKSKPVLRRTLTYTKGRRLMRGADVGRVQALVGAKVDNDYGPSSKRAVALWQRRHHLEADGEFGRTSARSAGWSWSPR